MLIRALIRSIEETSRPYNHPRHSSSPTLLSSKVEDHVTRVFEWASPCMERMPEESDDSDDAACKSDGSDLENMTDEGFEVASRTDSGNP
ncbi:hypothetical protein B5807_01534 [Epicoccum nigrum]|uniref:Uncharacterized protein n=1 Tax=Epicoccum nigrum TaxID=105696 RepID=A0A1Y2MDL4_EPING|nr:hypothetical protein B5807_01534 [Epicoccum nigrum]